VERSSTRVLKIAVVLLLTLVSATAMANGSGEDAEAVEDPVIWSGERITFTKADGADPNLEANQDRITENVWITRGNNGGQIFNIQQEERATKPTSPAGTLWAEGTTDELESLTFRPFRPAVGSPKSVAGKNLVLHIVDEGIFIDVTFLSWSSGKEGGFSYERTTP
jgi:hypothetical protein